MCNGQKHRDDVNDDTLKGLVGSIKCTDRRLMLQIKNTGAWLKVHGNTVTGTVLLATEYCDLLCVRYNVNSLKL